MPLALDDLMETASQALAALDYARCESLCLDALAMAREAKDWVLYQRVLLPLQEARRQKRQAALDGTILLGTPHRKDDPTSLLARQKQGCIVLTWPYTASDAAAFSQQIKNNQRAIEILYADNAITDSTWRITIYHGPELSIDLPAPTTPWLGQCLSASEVKPPTPAHWFMQASEALGNAALAGIEQSPGSLDYLISLEKALACVDDHEILHQRLAAAAKALHEARR